MATALADNNAAVAAGYRRVQGQRPSGVFFTRYEKSIQGSVSGTPSLQIPEAESTVSQAAADTAALLMVNNSRNLRYGHGAAGGNKDNQGQTLVVDED